jgi:DNA polymerase III subunit chi
MGAAMAEPTEALFYHLERQPLDRILPVLVERTVERGWRAVIQAGSEDMVEQLNTLLWTFKDDGFLPHGTAADGPPERQPVYLTTTDECPNGAAVRFLVDGAKAKDHGRYRRLVYLFDGHDADAVGAARAEWKTAKAAGCAVTYWQQTKDGKWERKA